ncbi:hypothetical protein IW261DRAFT_1602879 [Armillaria novae-zelandiae]|uniref:VWFA domain-containing protein n=1 Tax=Armillaria novae-zelandiae TaxID=153914 RepID=A0AA39UIK4_9AGAR|nr:hypothetical protein IW261DRAFT_1602879 [Armillaria novae-zelandiae]
MEPLAVPPSVISATDTSQLLAHDSVNSPIPGRLTDSMVVDKIPKTRPEGPIDSDLVHEIPGMYRLLDLISEPGSGGLVDKIIIAQDSLKQFANDRSPGAYVSLTKVDFNILDQFSVKPVGVYGSKEEIVPFISSLTVVAPSLCQILTGPQSDLGPSLRSGLYALDSPTWERLFVIYWPEDTTWNDDAISAVKRNRVTFMRYLTKICDQLVCMISPEQAASLSWKEPVAEDSFVGLDDDTDRLFTFEVHKTDEQEENVTIRPGFKAYHFISHCSSQHQTIQAFVTAKYNALRQRKEAIGKQVYNAMHLESLLLTSSVCLDPSITDREIAMLIDNGLNKHYPAAKRQSKWNSDEAVQTELSAMLKLAVVQSVTIRFPTLKKDKICPTAMFSDEESMKLHTLLSNFLKIHPAFAQELDDNLNQEDLMSISSRSFVSAMNKILVARCMVMDSNHFTHDQRRQVIRNVLSSERLEDTISSMRRPRGRLSFIISLFRSGKTIKVAEYLSHKNMDLTDAQFLSSLDEIRRQEPLLQEAITDVVELAEGHLQRKVDSVVNKLRRSKADKKLDKRTRESKLIDDIETQNKADLCTLIIDSIDEHSTRKNKEYELIGWKIEHLEPSIEYTVHSLILSEEDRHRIQMDSSFIPTPHIEPTLRLSSRFELPLSSSVLYMHLVASGKCLLIIDNGKGNISIYLEQLSVLDNAIQHNRPRKVLHKDKLGENPIIAYDETKRMLLLCASSKLYLFAVDETHCTIQGWGSPISLAPWYASQSVTISHACFVCGSEEILLIDNGCQARVFSLITQQFRPATLPLNSLPRAVYSSPDGACLLLAYTREDQTILQAYHWNSFGSSHEITLQLPLGFANDCILSSFVNRNCIHLISLDEHSQSCSSVILDITKKITEFQFKEKGGNRASHVEGSQGSTRHNSLIECFSDVWTRFPVVAAIQHSIGGGNGVQAPKALTFATDRDFDNFGPHFSDMVHSFELRTRKPTNDVLRHIQVRAVPLSDIGSLVTKEDTWPVSQFPLGAWLVNLFCLIPIHIAITRENRFLPLKDGVVSVEWEKSLLGAEVGKIIDSVSLGWYESIFQSYMAKKPVRVVSSMGEAVGWEELYTESPRRLVFCWQCYEDNGSDGLFPFLRRNSNMSLLIEGVWLSVTPTDDTLIVALDFEGVHSIERSTQEDTLLVLFNTAISNMVLFRNNFALSRDITGLFQSFQSSSTVLDPATNPSLFQSTLVIIIKDVTDIDKGEIVKEFSTKFQQIVQDEQDANFISRLHSGKLNIVPWPIIESKSFYGLFSLLRKRLDQEILTHPAAGEFLLTLKTLMAKLKANDWGALSQSLVAHRAQRLLEMLPNALMYGYSEIDPEYEPLKNFDTGVIIDGKDSGARFFLDFSGKLPARRELTLDHLRSEWQCNHPRQEVPDGDWADSLEQHLQTLVDMRVNRVRAWIESNLSRFTATHATITELNREFENAQVDLMSNVTLFNDMTPICPTTVKHLTGALTLANSWMDTSTKQNCADSLPLTLASTYAPSAPIHAASPAGFLKITIPMYATIGCAQFLVNFANVYALTPTIYTGWTCTRCIFAVCAALGTCEIDTAPQSIKATFTGRHETFQYTKYSQVAKRLQCAIIIPAGKQQHEGPHIHSTDPDPFHFCESRCNYCGYYCTLPLGHVQQEHETSHGSMSKTRWAVDGPAGTSLEINGHTFGSGDDGAPMMCNLASKVHSTSSYIVSYSWPVADPYSHDDKSNFAKCDAMCSGPEHAANATNPAHPSYCILPLFHPPETSDERVGMGYLSNDGHVFSCKNPVVLQQAFHVMFVIDRSSSMGNRDRRPLKGTPVTASIRNTCNNRLGAVYSALHAFWVSRHAAVTANGRGRTHHRRDSYSVILFDNAIIRGVVNDFTSSPQELLNGLLQHQTGRGTNYNLALNDARTVMAQNWSTERTPIIILLSDGECSVEDETVQDLCHTAVALGIPLSLQTVSFGPYNAVLRRIAQIALDVQNNAPPDPNASAAASRIDSSYAEALDSVRLAETFLGIAESLRKPRGSLLQ